MITPFKYGFLRLVLLLASHSKGILEAYSLLFTLMFDTYICILYGFLILTNENHLLYRCSGYQPNGLLAAL